MLKISVLAAALAVSALAVSGAAYADEVVVHHDAPDVVVAPPASSTTVVKHGSDCDSKTVHTESDAGDSHTVTHRDCD